MNNIFKYTGVICLVIFSFFYTEKAINIANNKDPIMQSIMSYQNKNNSECIEGTIKNDEAILGINGYELNVNKSYNNMRGIGFDEELMVFDETKCEVTKDKVVDKYIIKGNVYKNSVSLLLLVNDGSYLENIVNICKNKDIKISLVVNGSTLETHKTFFEEIYESGFDILYNGTDEVDLEKYNSIMKKIDKKASKYCVYSEKNDLLDLCKDNKINSIKSNIIIEKDLFMNIKNYAEKGNFIILKENEETVKELGASINFIKAKGLNIKSLSDHLKQEMN